MLYKSGQKNKQKWFKGQYTGCAMYMQLLNAHKHAKLFRVTNKKNYSGVSYT